MTTGKTNTPATHCQLCGAAIKLTKSGKIWQHGAWYNRKVGWENPAVCPGSSYAPFEVSRDRVPAEIAREEARLAELQAQLANIIETPPPKIRGGYGEYQRPADFSWKNWPPRPDFRTRSQRERRDWIGGDGSLTDWGQWLRSYEYAVFVLRDVKQEEIRDSQGYIDWHRDRCAAWPQDIPWSARRSKQ